MQKLSKSLQRMIMQICPTADHVPIRVSIASRLFPETNELFCWRASATLCRLPRIAFSADAHRAEGTCK